MPRPEAYPWSPEKYPWSPEKHPWSLRVPLSVSSRCRPEPTARPTMPSARPTVRRGCRDFFAIAAAMLGMMHWMMLGAACLAGEAVLDTPVTATWSGIGLREWAGRVSETAGLPVLVDHRLDPDTTIRLECREEPLLDVLKRAAAVADGEVARLRSSVVIVPLGLATVVARAEQARESRVATLPTRQRSVLDSQMPWQWPAGARPRDLVAAAATKAGITLEGTAMVPHDHLPATSLADLTLAEGLDLLLTAYDLRVDWQVAHAAAGSPASRVPTGQIIAIDAGLPPAAATAIAGTPAAARPAAGKPPRRPSPDKPKPATDKQTFSLQVAAPLEELLTVIAARLGLKLDLDHESLARCGIAPREIVRATVKDASRDELLAAILGPLSLRWTINDDTLRVFAR